MTGDEVVPLGGGTAISGGGRTDTGGGTPFLLNLTTGMLRFNSFTAKLII